MRRAVLEDQCLMGAKTTDMYGYSPASFPSRKNVAVVAPLNLKEAKNHRRGSVSLSQGGGGHGKRRWLCMNYFSLESFVLLVCLTASVLLLPLILPPLPPPPFMLLLLPICILVVLVFLAFSPSSGKSMTHPYL